MYDKQCEWLRGCCEGNEQTDATTRVALREAPVDPAVALPFFDYFAELRKPMKTTWKERWRVVPKTSQLCHFTDKLQPCSLHLNVSEIRKSPLPHCHSRLIP